MADIKISALPAAGPLTGDELILLSQGGADATMLLSDLPGGGLLPLPETAANQIDLLVAVYNNNSNFAGVNCTCPSGYVVDWGDGSTSETTSSAITLLTHKYAWDDINPDTLTHYGYRLALVKITPRVPGNQFTGVSISPGLNTAFPGLSSSIRMAIIVAQINAPNSSTFDVGGNFHLRSIVIHSLANVVTSGFFNGCSALNDVKFMPGSLGMITGINYLFNGCRALKEVSFPSDGALGNVTTAGGIFTGPGGKTENLSRLDNFNCPVSFSLAANCLGPDELNAVFAALPTVSGRTITITNNWGAATCDTSIATAKGWTVAS